MSVLGERLEEARKETGRTISHVANMTGISRSYIHGVEKDKISPNPTKIKTIAELYDMNIEKKENLLFLCYIHNRMQFLKPLLEDTEFSMVFLGEFMYLNQIWKGEREL